MKKLKRFFSEISWLLSSQSRLKIIRLSKIEELEMGKIHYIRKSPHDDFSGFIVFLPIEDDSPHDFYTHYISDEQLRGIGNCHYVSVKEAKEKEYAFDYDFLISDYDFSNYPDPDDYDSQNAPEMDDSCGLSDEQEKLWIKNNVPEENQIVFADLGRKRIVPYDGVSSSHVMKHRIEKRRNVYRLTDKKMVAKLEKYQLINSLEKWQ
ncbi:MAG: hypothetical protein JXR48_15230 [Candidatus Delongbacteria bacterium]|nr:hypothetical protein [Candidatus Delongbacteria bacterium]